MSRRSFKDLFYRIILFYFVLITPFAVMGYMFYNYRTQKYLLVTQKDQQANIQLQISKLKELFRHVNADLLIGSNHPQVINVFSEDPKVQDYAKDKITDFCVNLLEYNNIFARARFIDVNGNEILNVRYKNGKAKVVHESKLKSRSTAYYLKEASKVVKNEIYISKLDFEVDSMINVDVSLPVIRFITPIFDEEGIRRGYFALNLFGKNLIEGLKTIGDELGWRNYMINKEGYYILAGNPEYDWKLLDPTKANQTLSDEQRELFNFFDYKKSGVLKNELGMFCFQEINVSELISGYNTFVVHDDSWMMVSVLPISAIEAGISEIITTNDLVLIVLSILLLMTIAGFLAVNTHRQREIQVQLAQSEKDLRVANRTKDKFISILAHDLKNPLASIMGFVDLLKDGYEQMPQKSKDVFIRSLENSTHLLLRLIDDILSWARSTTGSMTVEREPFLVNKMLEHAITYSQMQAEKKNIKLERKYTEKLVGFADPRMIETIIRNLISNAIKFSFNDSTVEIRMCQDTNLVYISVKDFGVGIDDKRAKDLFKLDQFTSTPGTGNEKGTGMGLILCQDFISKNKGEITVQSKLGEGSVFTISFPAYAND